MVVNALTSFRRFLRANFIAGLFIAVPFGVTVALLVWVWKTIHVPLKQIFEVSFTTEQMPWSDFGDAIKSSNYEKLLVPIFSAMLVVFAILILGMLTRSIFGRMALSGAERMVGQLPIIGMLYMSLKQLGEAFLTTDGKSKFERAVAVQFPYKGCWAIGFVTGIASKFPVVGVSVNGAPPAKLLTVFVPTTPLPTAGFMVAVPENETVPLDMTVQDALKMVVSGGMLNPADSQRLADESEITRMIRRETNKMSLNKVVKPEAAES